MSDEERLNRDPQGGSSDCGAWQQRYVICRKARLRAPLVTLMQSRCHSRWTGPDNGNRLTGGKVPTEDIQKEVGICACIGCGLIQKLSLTQLGISTILPPGTYGYIFRGAVYFTRQALLSRVADLKYTAPLTLCCTPRARWNFWKPVRESTHCRLHCLSPCLQAHHKCFYYTVQQKSAPSVCATNSTCCLLPIRSYLLSTLGGVPAMNSERTRSL